MYWIARRRQGDIITYNNHRRSLESFSSLGDMDRCLSSLPPLPAHLLSLCLPISFQSFPSQSSGPFHSIPFLLPAPISSTTFTALTLGLFFLNQARESGKHPMPNAFCCILSMKLNILLTLCGLTSQKTHRGGLGLGELVHEEAHPCFPYIVQPPFKRTDAGSTNCPLVQLIPSINYSV